MALILAPGEKDNDLILDSRIMGLLPEWNPRPTEFVDSLLEDIKKMYYKCESNVGRRDTLSAVALSIPYATILEYIPGLTRYAYTEARNEARRRIAGYHVPPGRIIRERYSKEAVNNFVEFITRFALINQILFIRIFQFISNG